MNKMTMTVIATLALTACGQPRGAKPQTPRVAPTAAAPTPSAPAAPAETTFGSVLAKLIGAEAAPVVPAPNAAIAPPEAAATIAPTEVPTLDTAKTAALKDGAIKAELIGAGAAVTARALPAPEATVVTPGVTDENTIFTNTLIPAAGPDGKCTRKFLGVHAQLNQRVEYAVANLETSMAKMRALLDANELTGDAQGLVRKDYATLRAAMTEFKQNFGRTFGCNDEYHGVIISSEPTFAKFKDLRQRLGKMIGTHLIGTEI